MYKIEFKLSLPLVLTSFPMVAMLMLLIAGGFELYQDISFISTHKDIKEDMDSKIFQVDLQSSMAIAHGAKSIKGLGVDNAQVYVLKVSSRKKGLSSLFSKLKNDEDSTPFKIVDGTSKQVTQRSVPNYNAFLNKNEKTAMNEKELKKLISSNTQLFRGCYNKMLIKDGLLSGIATITISKNGLGSSNFKGVGRAKVINELKDCLNSQTSKIDLSTIELTKVLRFSLSFSS